MDTLEKLIKISKYLCISLFVLQTFQKGIVCTNCRLKENCGECIAENPVCAWCSQENFTENGGRRCDFLPILEKTCNKADISAPMGSMQSITDKSLSDKGAKESEAIQIKPQEIRIKLRPNSVQKLSVEFRQAVDYPIDLYYLMDLSNSMADDKMKLASLGNKLAAEMKTITTNFKLGFGSFVDKTVAPYINSHPDKKKEPCPQCAAPYSFKNNMPLSSNTKKFAMEVDKAPVSGNLDAPEGGFDALMQAIVCKDEIGWRNQSRKLLVFSTDNAFHYAGDGRLGGIITPNDERCHLDKDGFYTESDKLDYPSLSQINRKIREHKINVIFAVTSDQVTLYDRLSKRLTGAGTGKLEHDSSNVVDLVRRQYDEITSSVEMIDDVGDTNVRISYFSSCLGDKKEQTNVCRGLKVGQNVTFEVNLEYAFCPQDPKERNRTFQIFPVGLQDYLTVHLEMMCECNCEKPWEEEPSSPKCSEGNGTYECGVCSCDAHRFGKKCECDSSETDPFLELTACFNGEDSRKCSGNGECICGKCLCNPGKNPDEKYYGTYCECNNYSCDKRDGKVCSGKDHGVCDCGKCKCLKEWKGDDCSCRATADTCVGPNGEVCSGHGKCACGACLCTEEGYYGAYCDDCPTCPGMCKELKECVECFLKSQKNPSANCSICGPVIVLPIGQIEVKEKEKQCSYEDDKKCRLVFKYAFDEHNQVTVWAKVKKECPVPVDVVAVVSGVSGAVVGTGLFLLMLWKLLTVIHDRRELAKFEKERLMAKWNQGQNPLYKEVETTYQNPAYGGSTSPPAEHED